MKDKLFWPCLALACLLGGEKATEAQNQSYNFDLQPFHPAATSGGLFSLEGTAIGAHLRPRAGIQLSYQHDPLIYERWEASDVEAVRSRINGELLISMGFFNRAELGLALPAVLYQSGEEMGQESGPRSAGLGDMRVIPKLRLLGRGPTGFSLAALAGIRVPTARGDSLAGAGIAVDPELVASFRQGNLSLHALAGFHYQKERDLFNLRVGEQILFGAGARYQLGRF